MPDASACRGHSPAPGRTGLATVVNDAHAKAVMAPRGNRVAWGGGGLESPRVRSDDPEARTIECAPSLELVSRRPYPVSRRLRTVGLFAGVGGIEIGLHDAGHELLLVCEID